MLIRGQLVLNLNLKDPLEVQRAINLLQQIQVQKTITEKPLLNRHVVSSEKDKKRLEIIKNMFNRPESLDIPQAERKLWASSGTVKLPKKSEKIKQKQRVAALKRKRDSHGHFLSGKK